MIIIVLELELDDQPPDATADDSEREAFSLCPDAPASTPVAIREKKSE